MRGDRQAAEAINSRLEILHRTLFVESNPIPVKWALYEMGMKEKEHEQFFLDGLAMDLERLTRINDTVGALTPEQRDAAGIKLRPIETLVISPSRRIDTIAGRHRKTLPPASATTVRCRSPGSTRSRSCRRAHSRHNDSPTS